MSQELLNHVAADSMRKKVPVLKPGQTVRVHTKIKEGDKTRVQVFEGLVLRINSGTGVSKTFTVRKVTAGIGVERIFPFFSPTIEKVEVVKAGKVRRSKLYYMRERSGKSARLREIPVGEVEEWGLDEEAPEPEVVEEAETPAETPEAPAEEPKAEETEEAAE